MGDRYTITERLDQGGMAEVFLGVAESLQGFKKNVAIKRILPSLTRNQKFVAMFLDEAKLSLFLQHANIVQVFDIGQSDNSYFLVMEYVNGCNLRALLDRLSDRGQRIRVAEAIYLILEACKGLSYAHTCENPENGEPLHIVHRDVSPPNILISKNGEVKLVDFGLAKANSQIESTDPGVVKGKFSYLSPEAASGLDIDQRADVFAVGILLWEMLTNRRLFLGESDYQTVELVRQARIPSLAAINPEIEPELEGIIRKALEREPDRRYQTAADLGDALAQYLFSRRMKVTARDIAALVRDTQIEQQRKRSLVPKESLIDAMIQDEMAKITSLLQGESPALDGADGAASLDPSSFVDTSSWAADLGFDDSAPHVHPERAASPSPMPQAVQPPRSRSITDEIQPLSQVLEPDRTGLHERPSQGRAVLVLLVVALVLTAAIGAGLFFFKDEIFG
jgi:eukaryotic-like serine/threonine-protein kinase